MKLFTSGSISKKLVFLVMDDEKMVCDLLEAMLNRMGHDVILAEDGEQAITAYKKALANNRAVDLTIMDLTIPGGMGGKKAVLKILAINPDAKVIVSSGYSNDPIMADYKKYGFCSAIVKPYQLQEISRVINQVIAE